MKSEPRALITLFIACVVAACTSAVGMHALPGPNFAQSGSQRQVDNTIPKQVPLKLNLKAEKEARFKDRTNTEWLGDFELEVTNTSNKPIYFVAIWLVLPEVKSDDNKPVAFDFRYGRTDFINFDTRPIPADVPIQPGETHGFTIDSGLQRSWQDFKTRRKIDDPARVVIRLVHLSFGDGSGFDGGGVAYPYDRNELFAKGCVGVAVRTSGTVQSSGEREFEDRIPKHLPVRIKIKPEKEKAAKDLNNDRWHHDLAFEVKNIGDRPIYYLSFYLDMPEIKPNGIIVGGHLYFGQRSIFGEGRGMAQPEDVPLRPNETIVLTLDKRQADGWDESRKIENLPQPTKLSIVFQELNFGDGTGFVGGTGAPWPTQRATEQLR